MVTGPKWKAALHMNERSTQEQKDALTKDVNVEAIEGGDKNKESLLLNMPFTSVRGADLTFVC
jgi:hypothetical protein